MSFSEFPTGMELPSLNQTQATQLSNLQDLHQFLKRNIQRTLDGVANPEATEQARQTANRLRDLLLDLEKLEKGSEAPKEKKSQSLDVFFGDSAAKEIPLNTERIWTDSVRHPVAISIDLLTRAIQLCEDNPNQCEPFLLSTL